MHILGQYIHFNITRAKSERKKLKSGYLELRFRVVIMCNYLIFKVIYENVNIRNEKENVEKLVGSTSKITPFSEYFIFKLI